MGMPLEFNTMIVTKGEEIRKEENVFELTKTGYRVYPLHIPIHVHKFKDVEASGTAIIDQLQWSNEKTVITYHLISLNTTN
ncbi:hypothetical protein J2S13_002196 [Oikeobacillus pervagus]|uniref:DUF2584 domain-containing protein n=1 Tax=Oikeobacillus pervagus TaxID=1325931 RepID=A0AAJ1WL33_9BACI|nr:DUF2584 domain-containing protein [Oikeobacillus pervagus]MDQ0215776.1 hypothetical protein [Oikeobacillus pervagus]